LKASSTAVAQRRANYHQPLLHVLRACGQLEASYGTASVPPIQTIELDWPPVEIVDQAQERQLDLQERETLLHELAAGARSLHSIVEHLHPDEATRAVELSRLSLSPAAE
jgi:hypothetical protein